MDFVFGKRFRNIRFLFKDKKKREGEEKNSLRTLLLALKEFMRRARILGSVVIVCRTRIPGGPVKPAGSSSSKYLITERVCDALVEANAFVLPSFSNSQPSSFLFPPVCGDPSTQKPIKLGDFVLAFCPALQVFRPRFSLTCYFRTGHTNYGFSFAISRYRLLFLSLCSVSYDV